MFEQVQKAGDSCNLPVFACFFAVYYKLCTTLPIVECYRRGRLSVKENPYSRENVFLQPPPDRHYVRSFLFSRRIDAPFAQVHLIARTLLILALSCVLLRTIDTTQPDIIGATLFCLVSFLAFLLSGMSAKVARLNLLLTLSPLLSLFITWVLFNPVPSHTVLLQFPVYSGRLTPGFAFWEPAWIATIGAYFFITRKLLLGMLLATLIAFLIVHVLPLPMWTFASVPFFHPLEVFISDQGILVAGTKVIGYAGMIFATIALVVTSRDTELLGALRQLHMPSSLIFFLSTVFRSLDLALSDYETIRQAQLARAINARPRTIIRRIRDFGSLAVPMVATMIRRSSEIGDALLLRGYTLGRPSADFYETSSWRFRDWSIVTISLGLLLLTFAPHSTLTHLLGW